MRQKASVTEAMPRMAYVAKVFDDIVSMVDVTGGWLKSVMIEISTL
jgi:hypothetical protein